MKLNFILNQNHLMESYHFTYFFLCILCLLCTSAVYGQTKSFESVPDLHRSMYAVVDANPCVRLLNLSGEIGCANPGREKVVAPIVKYNKDDVFTRLSTFLVSLDRAQSFFQRLAEDPEFARNVGGLLVETSTDDVNELGGFSPDEKFPQAKYSPYENRNYEWNPNGLGIMWNAYSFPIFLLSKNSTLILKEVANNNEKNKNAYSMDVAEFHLIMQTTKSGTHDSRSCLEAKTCLPLGGYSVWSSLPPINVSSAELKPVILTVASMDAASFFRDKSPGADSPISGFVALLAAVDALSYAVDFKRFKKQLAFLVLTGESWGYLGSRRFLHELERHTDATKGLNSTMIEMVMEIGSVGKGYYDGVTTLYAHQTRDSLAVNETVSALHKAQASQPESIKISTAKTSNPGIPPSSLMAFLNKYSKTSGIVLEDFDSVFANNYYHSHLDNISNVNSKSIAAAASLVARTLFVLASETTDLSTSEMSSVSVNVSLVEDLLKCFLNCDPGLSCELLKNYISVSSKCPGNYVGVLLEDPSSTPYSGYSSDISRFVWNFLSEKTSIIGENASSDCKRGCNNLGEVCIKAEVEGKSTCVNSTTRYVPAYSTRLKFEAGSWSVLPPNTSDPMDLADPVWTESNWDMIGVQIYTQQDVNYNILILVIGLAVTVFSYAAIVVTKSCIAKALKMD